jgi:hypothetical protein
MGHRMHHCGCRGRPPDPKKLIGALKPPASRKPIPKRDTGRRFRSDTQCERPARRPSRAWFGRRGGALPTCVWTTAFPRLRHSRRALATRAARAAAAGGSDLPKLDATPGCALGQLWRDWSVAEAVASRAGAGTLAVRPVRASRGPTWRRPLPARGGIWPAASRARLGFRHAGHAGLGCWPRQPCRGRSWAVW